MFASEDLTEDASFFCVSIKTLKKHQFYQVFYGIFAYIFFEEEGQIIFSAVPGRNQCSSVKTLKEH